MQEEKSDDAILNLLVDKANSMIDLIQTKTLSDQQLMLNMSEQDQINTMSPVAILRLFIEARVSYEMYIHQYASYLSKLLSSFPILAELTISVDEIFQRRSSYPLFDSWQIEKPTNVSIADQQLFISPQMASYLSLALYNDEQVNPKKIKQKSSDYIQQISRFSRDIQQTTMLIKNSHPLQNLTSLAIKFPEIILILGQRQQSHALRISLYKGYILQLETIFVNSDTSDSSALVQDQSSKQFGIDINNCFPRNSFMTTPFTRMIIAAVSFSLSTANQKELEKWPPHYYYQPFQQGNYFLFDFLLSLTDCESVKQWCQATFFPIVQDIFAEQAINYFEFFCQDSLDNYQVLANFIQLIALIVKRILLKLKQLPNLIKTVLTISKLIIHNFILNIIYQLKQTTLSQPSYLKEKFKNSQYDEIIDRNNSSITDERAYQLSKQLFSQFFNVFIILSICGTAFNNPASYQLLKPIQASVDKNNILYSNLSFIIDVVFMVFSGKSAIFSFQVQHLDDRKPSKTFSQYQFKNKLCLSNFEHNLIILFQQLERQVSPFLSAKNDHHYIYDIDPQTLAEILQTKDYKLQPQQITSGFWVGSSSYFLFLCQQFLNKSNFDYTQQTIRELHNVLCDVFKKVYSFELSLVVLSTNSEDKIYKFFQQDQKLCLFENVTHFMQKVKELLLSYDSQNNFLQELISTYGEFDRITVVPYFDDILKQKKDFESNQTQSETLQIFQNKLSTAESQQNVYNAQMKQNQSFNFEMQGYDTEANTEVKQFFSYVKQKKFFSDIIAKLKDFIQQMKQKQFSSEEERYEYVNQQQHKLESQQNQLQNELNQYEHFNYINFIMKEQKLLQELCRNIHQQTMLLIQNEPDQYQKLIQDDTFDKQIEEYTSFKKIEQQYFQQKRQSSFDDMIINYQQMKQNYSNYEKELKCSKPLFNHQRPINFVFGDQIEGQTQIFSQPKQIPSQLVRQLLGQDFYEQRSERLRRQEQNQQGAIRRAAKFSISGSLVSSSLMDIHSSSQFY